MPQQRHQGAGWVPTQTEEEARRQVTLVGYQQSEEGSENRGTRPHVTWTEDTIDNEHLNRKKSKICCIYHPPDEDCECSSESEDSDSSSSSSSSSSDSDSDDVGAKSRPNAYERQPRPRQQHRRHVHPSH